MQQKSPKWIEDTRASAPFISQASAGKIFQDYESDPLLRAPVERHFVKINSPLVGSVRGRWGEGKKWIRSGLTF